MEYYWHYDCTCYFSVNCCTKRCRRSKSEQAWEGFCQCNAEVCENTAPLMEMRSEEDEDFDESFWTLVSRLLTFNVFCSHITWQNCCLFSSEDKFPIWRLSSDNTLYMEIFQCNLYLGSYGRTKKSVILCTSSQIHISAWVFS